ncbi:NADP-binding protein [Dacryopinax primogenitus]|uniref:NADP-binding protein n=1 Tax=Dacryopinax primogenitus (strain DJM 731) TaxID=1858805 RepID=M5G3I9_DACPD|nr:NADP-binding protein [Dacryopinax primogenitus]EJT98322.1 NADP-binding protein [Dacryopinax primogenitus]
MDYLRWETRRVNSFFTSVFPPAAKWSFNDIPDLTNMVIVVTGGNAGIGKSMCRELVAHNARVYTFCRNPSKAEAAISDIKQATGKNTIWNIQCDLASFPSVLSAARELLLMERDVHVVFCNAGVWQFSPPQVTQHGHDMSFGVNVVAHAYLIKLLLPVMQATAKRSPAGTVRVVMTSSSAPIGAPKNGINYSTLKDGPERDKAYHPYHSYYQSKWGLIAYTHALVRHYPLAEYGVTFVSLDPGWIRTDIWEWQKDVRKQLRDLVLCDTDKGALTPLYAGVSPEVRNGGFYVPWAREGKSRGDTEWPDLQEKLWDWVQEELKDLPLDVYTIPNGKVNGL